MLELSERKNSRNGASVVAALMLYGVTLLAPVSVRAAEGTNASPDPKPSDMFHHVAHETGRKAPVLAMRDFSKVAIPKDIMEEAVRTVAAIHENGLLILAQKIASDFDMPVAQNYCLLRIESNCGVVNAKNKRSSGKGALSILDGPFAERVYKYGVDALPVVAKRDPAHAAQFARMVKALTALDQKDFDHFYNWLAGKGPAKRGYAEWLRNLDDLRLKTAAPSLALTSLWQKHEYLKRQATARAKAPQAPFQKLDERAQLVYEHLWGMGGVWNAATSSGSRRLGDAVGVGATNNNINPDQTIAAFVAKDARKIELEIAALDHVITAMNLGGPHPPAASQAGKSGPNHQPVR